MSKIMVLIIATVLAGASLACGASVAAAPVTVPDPKLDAPLAPSGGEQTVVLSGGCFWGIQAVFQHVKGVKKVDSGYSGGSAETAEYEIVSTGETGHAESVRIVYDPSKVTYGQLLKVFFSVAHDPTQLNRQGPDSGTQYRSALFYANDEQQRIAAAYIEQLNQAKIFKRPIVTQVVRFKAFYKAEDYHQDYAVHHPDDRYIVVNDLPKVENLRKQLPELYVSR